MFYLSYLLMFLFFHIWFTGLACMTVMFVTTFLMALVIMFVWQKNILIATIFLLFFWVIEGLYLSAALIKVFQGGWVPLVLSFIFMLVMHVWHYGTCTKYNYDLSNKVSLKWLLALGPIASSTQNLQQEYLQYFPTL